MHISVSINKCFHIALNGYIYLFSNLLNFFLVHMRNVPNSSPQPVSVNLLCEFVVTLVRRWHISPPNLESGSGLTMVDRMWKNLWMPVWSADLKVLCFPNLSFGQEVHHENKSGQHAGYEGPCREELSFPSWPYIWPASGIHLNLCLLISNLLPTVSALCKFLLFRKGGKKMCVLTLPFFLRVIFST